MSRRRRGGQPYTHPADARTAQATPPAAGTIVRGQALDLGELAGEAVEPVMATFTWFGRRFRVNPDLTETTLIDLFEKASRIELEGPPKDPSKMTEREMQAQARRVVREADESKSYVREHIHPDDFEDLWATARANRQGMQALMELCWKIIELIAERPTSPPSGYSDGRPDIRPSSLVGASPPADDALPTEAAWWPQDVPFSPLAAKYVEQFEAAGRPDKANIIMMAQEARARAVVSAEPTG